jgi:hypothetical protein
VSRRRAVRGAAAGAVAIAVAVAAIVAIVGASGAPKRHRARPAAPATEPRAALPAPTGEAFGVNVNRLFNDFTDTPAQIDGQLAAIHAAGATIARTDALWEATEPHAPVAGRHTYAWGFDDEIAGELAAHGLTWLPILDYTAPWAQSTAGLDHSPPRSDADYAAYAGAFAARYGPAGSYWSAHPAVPAQPVTTIEIWNEPDSGYFWAPAPDAAGYAALYLTAREAVDAVDPGIRVLVGGLTDPPAFLAALVAARPELRDHVDGVAIHPYGPPAVVVAKVRGARSALVGLGMGAVPLYVTEFGWTTRPAGAVDYTPASRRPGEIVATLTALGHLDCGLAASLLYTWVTPERDPSDGQDWYGIADPADPSAPTPDVAAFGAGLRAAVEAPAAGGTPAPAPCPG